MSTCFWDQMCDCPDQTPAGQACTEHGGHDCSLLNGQRITDSRQINDATTALIQAAIDTVDQNGAELRRLQGRVTDLQDDVLQQQTEFQDLQDELDGNPGFFRRISIARRINRVVTDFRDTRVDINQRTQEIDTIAQRPIATIQQGVALLIRPYADPNGYCTCHDEKVRRLNVLDGQITTDLGLLNTQLANATNMKNAAVLSFSGFAAITVGIGARLVLFAVFGKVGLVAAVGGFLAILALALVLLAALLLFIAVVMQINATRRRLLVTIREYYRVQQIPVCIQGAPDGVRIPDPLDFLRELFEEQFGQSPLEPGQ